MKKSKHKTFKTLPLLLMIFIVNSIWITNISFANKSDDKNLILGQLFGNKSNGYLSKHIEKVYEFVMLGDWLSASKLVSPYNYFKDKDSIKYWKKMIGIFRSIDNTAFIKNDFDGNKVIVGWYQDGKNRFKLGVLTFTDNWYRNPLEKDELLKTIPNQNDKVLMLSLYKESFNDTEFEEMEEAENFYNQIGKEFIELTFIKKHLIFLQERDMQKGSLDSLFRKYRKILAGFEVPEVKGKPALVPFFTDGKWGYLASDGSQVIPPIFDNAGLFNNNLAPVSVNGKWGLINPYGKTKLPGIYGLIEYIGGIYYRYKYLESDKENGLFGVFDSNLNVIAEPFATVISQQGNNNVVIVYKVSDFQYTESDERSLYNLKSKSILDETRRSVYMDNNSKNILSLGGFSGNSAFVPISNKWVHLNYNGEPAGKYRSYESVGIVSEGMVAIYGDMLGWGYYSLDKANFILSYKYNTANEFYNGVAKVNKVKTNNVESFNYIKRDGKLLYDNSIKCKVPHLMLANDIIPVCNSDASFTVINNDDNKLILPSFKIIGMETINYVAVKRLVDNTIGVLDNKGIFYFSQVTEN